MTTQETDYEALRARADEFCRTSWPLKGDEANLPHREQVIRWQKQAIEAGLLHRSFAEEYGGGGQPNDLMAESVIKLAFSEGGVPWQESTPNGPYFVAPALLECGTQEQKLKYIPPTLTGEFNWCQGYSEPGAGSDLASLTCRAELTSDGWLLNGQKLWTSNAHVANWMFGIFRSERDAPRSRGVSFLVLPMDTPGIDVRTIKTMHGSEDDICEVFFDDALVPAENIIGERGEGWIVARSVLRHERVWLADTSLMIGQFARLLDLAREMYRGGRRAIDDRDIQQELARIEAWVECQVTIVGRLISAEACGDGDQMNGEIQTLKLLACNTQAAVANLALDLLGDHGLIAPTGEDITTWGNFGKRVSNARWVDATFASLANNLGGGTPNMQRNAIGESLLGLPRDRRGNR